MRALIHPADHPNRVGTPEPCTGGGVAIATGMQRAELPRPAGVGERPDCPETGFCITRGSDAVAGPVNLRLALLLLLLFRPLSTHLRHTLAERFFCDPQPLMRDTHVQCSSAEAAYQTPPPHPTPRASTIYAEQRQFQCRIEIRQSCPRAPHRDLDVPLFLTRRQCRPDCIQTRGFTCGVLHPSPIHADTKRWLCADIVAYAFAPAISSPRRCSQKASVRLTFPVADRQVALTSRLLSITSPNLDAEEASESLASAMS